MKKKQRPLESYEKADLIAFIREHSFFFKDAPRSLMWIEYKRVTSACFAKSDALNAEMAACTLPQDWDRYKALSAEWDRTQKKLDRAFKAVE